MPHDDKKYVLIVGNPIDGFCFHGPFDTTSDAISFVDENENEFDDLWWVGTLIPAKCDNDGNWTKE